MATGKHGVSTSPLQPGSAQALTTETAQQDKHSLRELHAQEAMAFWAGAMFWAALATLLVTSIGTLLIWRQVKLTRKAVEDTSLATDAMREGNQIARETMRQQLRAYLTVQPCGINEPENGRHRVPILIHNSGTTPAHNVMVFSHFGIAKSPQEFDPARDNVPLSGERSDGSLGGGEQRYLFCYLREEFARPYWSQVSAQEAGVVHFGYAKYDDVFGETHHTRFAFFHWGEELSDTTSLRCSLGNSAD